jgi:xylulokinase
LRALIESVAYEYAYYLCILRELLPTLKLIQARAVGGGARSPIWNQIKADILDVPYQRLQGNEFGTWGAAMIAGKAAGLIDDLATHAAKTVFTDGLPVRPDPEHHKIYQPLIEKYIHMEKMLDQFFTSNA